MDNNLLKKLILDQKASFLRFEDLIERDIVENKQDLLAARQVIVISGVRRAGKSSFMKLLAQELLQKQKIDPRQIFYVNFEDEFFVDFQKDDFSRLLSAFYEHSGLDNEEIYCFFDEIQNVPFWEKWINKLYEAGNFKIFITGSNSSLLSSEIATALTGRNYAMEIFPFSFAEFLRYQNISFRGSLNTKEESRIKKQFNNYLFSGGFPETLKTKLDILPDYYNNIVYRDIVSRFQIKNTREFRELSLYLAANNSSLMSYRELAKRVSGLDSSMTVKNYVSYLEEAYLFFQVRKFDASSKRQMLSPFKIYGIDNGLLKSIAFGLSDNLGKLNENLAFLSLRRQKGRDIYYYKDNYENDFVVMRQNSVQDAIQVTSALNDAKTLAREQRGLVEAMRAFQLKTGYIINDDLEKQEKIKGLNIKYIPMWKWLLKQNGS